MGASSGVAIGVGVLLAATSCAQKLSLEHRRCPCSAGYHCCIGIDTCRVESEPCPLDESSAGSGGASQTNDSGNVDTNRAGSTSTGGAPNAGGGPNAGGASSPTRDAASVPVEAGAPKIGEAGSDANDSIPRWRQIGQASLAGYEVRDSCDLELDASGTPYIAVRSCTKCSSLDPAPPVILRYEGGGFRRLPEQGLPATTLHSPLVIGADDLPHLLVDDVVQSFDGASWQPNSPPVTPAPTPARNFELDGEGRFVVTAYDPSPGTLSVVRLEGGTWNVVGAPVASDAQGERLATVAGSLWLAHTAGRTGAAGVGKLFVRKLVGSLWSVVEELPPAAFEFAVTPGESVYVARQNASLGPASVTEGRGMTWMEIRSFSPLDIPVLRVAPDDSLFSTYLMDGFVNLSRWDGSAWTDFDQKGLGTASSTPAIRIVLRAGRLVPYLCFARGTALYVMKYE